ncbi:hypothetical protein V1Y59_00780 [Gordonia sp. PKS22-38]|uniref:EthD domain-containing protein n=2 Tax=Gordonia prachuapensis TaxID=3115651 RepID=A0ABU7MPA0_9ACTN|nr:hypothetical protein [Gordonia sp. PKS22-38]
MMAAVWGDDLSVFLSADFRDACLGAGAERVQVNLCDGAVAGAMRISELDPPIDAVVSFWVPAPQPVLDLLADLVPRVAAWSVTERLPLTYATPGDGSRVDALANVAFLRRPGDLAQAEWLRRWLEEHTQVAIETQATFGYVQNVVDEPLTPDAPLVDAIVEELFPMAAVADMHAFYGSGGDQAELERRMTRMLESVVRFGADRNLDVVPTSRYDFDFSAG